MLVIETSKPQNVSRKKYPRQAEKWTSVRHRRVRPCQLGGLREDVRRPLRALLLVPLRQPLRLHHLRAVAYTCPLVSST
jgi:hypothetical protein